MKPILFLPLTTLLLAGLACGKTEAPQGTALPTAKVHLTESGQSSDAGWIAATLTATQRATLSTRMAASVKKVHVNEGQHVAAGALLVSLADEDLQGGLKAAEAAVDAATAYHRRIAALIEQKAAIPAEMDMARTQLAQAQAAVAQMKANIAYTQIRAPFAGVIQSRMVNEGVFVGPGMPLVDIEGQGALELVGSVSETEAKGLKMGQKLPFEADGKTGSATITALATGGDPVSHRGTLRARILTGGASLRTGSFARLKLPGTKAPSEDLSVPRTALVLRGELSGVFVNQDGKATLRWLSLGEAQGDRIPVRAGLTKGDQVIDLPGSLVDGQPVEVVK
jgi:RND family efflux transporter MFP subunit